MALVIFENTQLNLIEDSSNDFLISSKDVAKGYGCSNASIRNHLKNHNEELKEGKHWIKKDLLTKGGIQSVTHWTKKGIVRLGFYIKSERATKFRDWAEDYIVNQKSSSDLKKILNQIEKQNKTIKILENELSLYKQQEQHGFSGYYDSTWFYRKRENPYALTREGWLLLLDECEKTLALERQNRRYKQLLISGASR
ncbi:BRO family protein [Aliarcobacter butzleri]